jgi:SAM-dependent methyltransferase
MIDNGFHPVRGRIEASFLDAMEGFFDRTYGDKKRSVFGVVPDTVVEIGPGPGANLRYYRPGTHLIAVEPNPAMHRHLQANARRYGILIDILWTKGESLALPDDCVNLVVGTLVLCSVDCPSKVVSEVYRVLKPGGRFAFLEHVSAPEGTRLRELQGVLRRPWRWLFKGCHIDRPTHTLLMGGGFAYVEMNRFMLHSPLLPITPHIFGQALK